MFPRRLPLILAAAALCAASAALAAEVAHRVAPASTVFTNSRGDPVASVWGDPDTGCEYLIRGDTMLPRLGPDGRPRCAPR